jgi:hypothetical protein
MAKRSKKTKHDWQSLNREVYTPEDMSLNDLFEEIRCAATDDNVRGLAFMLDDGKYAAFGRRIATMLQWMGDEPTNKTAPAKRMSK